MLAARTLFAVLCCVLASGQVFSGGDEQLPAECFWRGDSCGAVATGKDVALYHQVTENFEECFSSTVVKGEYVQRYSGCGFIPANWTTVTDLQPVLRLMIECQEASVVSSQQCDSFRRDLYIALQCPQCVEPANAVAAASAVCGMLTTAAQCRPEAAAVADFEDTSHLDPIVAPGPSAELVLTPGGRQEQDGAPLTVDLPGSGLDGVFPSGVPDGALAPFSARELDLADVPALAGTSDSSSATMNDTGGQEAALTSAAPSTHPRSAAVVGVLLIVFNLV